MYQDVSSDKGIPQVLTDFFFFNVYITKLIQVIIIGSRIIEYKIM